MAVMPSFASLRARLTAAVMIPLLALVVVFGGTTCWQIHRSLSDGSDRTLIGSVRILSRAIDADRRVRAQLFPLAVHLLQRRGSATTHFSVYHGDRLLAGTAGLTPPSDYDFGRPLANDRHPPATFARTYRNPQLVRGYVDPRDAERVIQPGYLRIGTLDGKQLRIATEIRFLHDDPHPIVIQVGDFLDDRAAYEQSRYLQVLGTGALIAALALLLFYGSITWGLRHFAVLTSQIEAAARFERPLDFRLALEPGAPREAQLLTESFNALLGRTQRAIESLRHFTSNASHQLRTPLAVARIHLDLLERFGPASPQGRQALDDMAGAIASLERLLLQLLSLARAEELPLDGDETFDLRAIAEAAVGDHVTQASAARIDLGFQVFPGVDRLPAYGYGAFVAEMIHNLVDNAIRYNRRGGNVTVSVERNRSEALLIVEDDGPGIAPAMRERVWERFFRLPGDSEREGSGLGLSIVRALADRMGAALSLGEGGSGRGLRLTVRFLRCSHDPAIAPLHDPRIKLVAADLPVDETV